MSRPFVLISSALVFALTLAACASSRSRTASSDSSAPAPDGGPASDAEPIPPDRMPDARPMPSDAGPSRDADATPPPPPIPRAAGVGEIIFVELMPNPGGISDAVAEWVELRNVSEEPLDLAGCRLTDGGVDDHTIAPPSGSLVVGAGELILLAKSDDPTVNGGLETVAYAFGAGFSLNSNADRPMLVCDVLVDEVSYEVETWPFDRGFAMQLDPARESHVDNDVSTSWCQASVPYFGDEYGSPGVPNSPCGI